MTAIRRRWRQTSPPINMAVTRSNVRKPGLNPVVGGVDVCEISSDVESAAGGGGRGNVHGANGGLGGRAHGSGAGGCGIGGLGFGWHSVQKVHAAFGVPKSSWHLRSQPAGAAAHHFSQRGGRLGGSFGGSFGGDGGIGGRSGGGGCDGCLQPDSIPQPLQSSSSHVHREHHSAQTKFHGIGGGAHNCSGSVQSVHSIFSHVYVLHQSAQPVCSSSPDTGTGPARACA